MSELADEFRSLLDQVQTDGRLVVIQPDGRPAGAVVSADDLHRLEQLDTRRAEAVALLREVGAAFADADPEELQREVDRAVAEARSELRPPRAPATSEHERR